MLLRAALIMSLLPVLASASPLGALVGTWGDARQCARDFIQEGGTVRAAPVVISAGWLRQGTIWCQLFWFPPQDRPDGLFATADALCGEDAVRNWRIGFSLTTGLDGDTGGTLRILWGESLVSAPLSRCAE